MRVEDMIEDQHTIERTNELQQRQSDPWVAIAFISIIFAAGWFIGF